MIKRNIADPHAEILQMMENRRSRANWLAAQRYSEVISNCAGIEEIDDNIREIGLKYNKMVLSGEIPADEASDKIKSDVGVLAQKKRTLLKKAGYDDNYLYKVHFCDKCGDTGFIDESGGVRRRCSCYEQLLIDLQYQCSNIVTADNACFDSFDPNLFPDGIDKKKYDFSISPRDNILMIRDSSIDYVNALISGKSENLYFFGQPGTGKTFIALSIAKCLLAEGLTVLYMSAPSLFNTITEYRMKAFRDENYTDAQYRSIINASLLIIDDLGTESMTASRYSEFLTLLNSRAEIAQNAKSTIISTNMDLKALRNAYDERIVSRIIGGFKIIQFFGDDLRLVLSGRQ